MSGVLRNSRERLEPTLLHFASFASAFTVFHASFFFLCINMKRQQKLTFFIEKKRALNLPRTMKVDWREIVKGWKGVQ